MYEEITAQAEKVTEEIIGVSGNELQSGCCKGCVQGYLRGSMQKGHLCCDAVL